MSLKCPYNSEEIISFLKHRKPESGYSVRNMENQFPKELKQFDPLKEKFSIMKYFGQEGCGKVGSLRLLADDHVLKNEKTIRGLYVFIHDNHPFYAGITRNMPSRIQQHLKGHNAVTATLAYRIARELYQKHTGEKPTKWERDEFTSYVNPIKDVLMNQELAFIPIEDDTELALYEIYFATKFNTMHNDFRTH